MQINRKLITYGINYIKTAGLAAAFLMVLKVLSGRVAVSKLDKYTSPEISSMSSFLDVMFFVLIIRFIAPQRCSIGFKSGELAGHILR